MILCCRERREKRQSLNCNIMNQMNNFEFDQSISNLDSENCEDR